MHLWALLIPRPPKFKYPLSSLLLLLSVLLIFPLMAMNLIVTIPSGHSLPLFSKAFDMNRAKRVTPLVALPVVLVAIHPMENQHLKPVPSLLPM
jgi:hypothetical protein